MHDNERDMCPGGSTSTFAPHPGWTQYGICPECGREVEVDRYLDTGRWVPIPHRSG